jgi:hypothetical protein
MYTDAEKGNSYLEPITAQWCTKIMMKWLSIQFKCYYHNMLCGDMYTCITCGYFKSMTFLK